MEIRDVREFLAADSPEELSQFVRGAESPDRLKERIPVEFGPKTIPLDRYDLDEKTNSKRDGSDDRVGPLDRTEQKESMWMDAVGDEGFERYAYYVPFHFSPRHHGIYIHEEGLQLLGHLLYSWSRDSDRLRQARIDSGVATETHTDDFEPLSSLKDGIELALEIFLRHEWYHYQIELLTGYVEDARDETHYVDYWQKIYDQTFPDSSCVEETLANAYAYRSRACANITPSGDLFRLLFHISTQSQPPAYATYYTALADSFKVKNRQLMKAIVEQDQSYLDTDSPELADLLYLGGRLPMGTSIRQGPVPINIIESDQTPPSLHYFSFVQLKTDYDIQQTPTWKDSLDKADPTLKQYAEKLIPKLEANAKHRGLNWTPCGGNRWYGRLSQQYRFVAHRYEDENRIELVDFGGHDLPSDYGCY